MRPRRMRLRGLAVALAITTGVFVGAGPATPASAHTVSCTPPSSVTIAGLADYLLCGVNYHVHEVEHDVEWAVFFVICAYKWYVQGEACL